MSEKILLFLVALLGLNAASAQSHQHDHDQSHVENHSHIHEIGVSTGVVYFLTSKEISIATHFHYVYNFRESNFGLGVGYERIFDEHKHNFLGLELNYRPVHPITLSISPGIVFEGEHPDEREFGLHFETVYEFELGAFHIGPVAEIAYHPEEWHISFGVHIGLGL